MAAALGLATCERPIGKDRPPASEWVVTMRGEAQDLDGLERAARGCGLGPIERRKHGDRKWLDIGLPAETHGKGGMLCLNQWLEAHPDAEMEIESGRVPANAPPDPAPAGDKWIPVAGSIAAIERLEAAARRCGATRIERATTDDGRPMTIIRDRPREPRDTGVLDCVWAWMNAHPDEGLDLVVRTPPR